MYFRDVHTGTQPPGGLRACLLASFGRQSGLGYRVALIQSYRFGSAQGEGEDGGQGEWMTSPHEKYLEVSRVLLTVVRNQVMLGR